MEQSTMRGVTFFLTYAGFIWISAMRASFPFVQYDLALYLQVDAKYLGFISTISNLLMGFGFFFRVFFPYNRIVRDYFINSNIVSLCLMGISISIYLQTKSVYLIAVFYGLFGWFQASLYPLALTLVNKKFSPEEDGCLLGFWSTSGDLGGVIGYLICTVIVYYIQAEWKLCLIVVPLLNIVVNFFFKGILQDGQTQEFEELTCRQKVDFFLNFFETADKTLMFCILFSVGTIQFGVLLWLPMYLQQSGFKDFEGYITISYGLFSLFGAITVGTMYEKVESRLNHFRIQASLLLISLVPLFLIYFLKFDESGKWIMLVLFGIAGFCVGANYDVYVTHESILSSNNNRQHILKNNSIVCGGLHVWVGLTQLLFGFASAANGNLIFFIFIIFVSIAFLLISLRICCRCRSSEVEQIQQFENDNE